MKLSVFLFLITGLFPFAVAAQCGQRDVSGRWAITLGESSTPIQMDVKQAGNRITGMARTTVSNNWGLEYGDNLTGEVTGDKIYFLVKHKSPSFTLNEEFKGTFAADGRITGTASIVAIDANLTVAWRSDRAMKCLFKPATGLGVKRTAPNTAPASTPKPPWLTAAPNNLALPFNVPVPPVVLAWDAGKDHPYAELWVKVDNQSEKKVLERGAGTLSVTAERGRNYVYILTDAGTTLATVNVRFPQ